MMSCRSSFILMAVCTLLLVGCGKPDTVEQFIKAGDAPDGVYHFELTLDNPIGTYDLSFYTGIDRFSPAGQNHCLQLDVLWRSPSGKTAQETVYMNTAKLREKYRSKFSPKLFGKWRIDVKVPEAPEGLLGLGIICEYNGTR